MVAANVREHIKQLLLSNLVSPHVLVMRAGANVIAQVASIEIPRGEWLEIVASLADNSMHEEVNIRRASITTLGFICEELKNVQTEINRQTCEQILGSLLICLRETSDIVEIALAALRESVVFLRHILEN
jgi:importin subunit beta-1